MIPTEQASSSSFTDVLDRLQAAFATLRVNLSATLVTVMPQENWRVRAWAMRLDIGRSLAHNMLQLATVNDVAVGLTAMPGENGWNLILEALRTAGVEEDRCASLRRAVQRIQELTKGDAAKRTTLRLLAAGGLEDKGAQRAMLDIRRRFQQAALELWGLGARGRLSTYVVSPSPKSEDRVDVAAWMAFDGLRRLRAGPPWPVSPALVSQGRAGRSGDASLPPLGETFGDASEWSPLVVDLSSPEAIEGGLCRYDEFVDAWSPGWITLAHDAPPSDKGMHAVFGRMLPSVGSRWAQDSDDAVNLSIGGHLPLEWIGIEVAVDRSLGLGSRPSAGLYLHEQSYSHGRWKATHRLPIAVEIEEVGAETEADASGVERFALPHAQRSLRSWHSEILARSGERFGCSREAFDERFRLWRAIVKYPPLPSYLWIGWDLPARPAP